MSISRLVREIVEIRLGTQRPRMNSRCSPASTTADRIGRREALSCLRRSSLALIVAIAGLPSLVQAAPTIQLPIGAKRAPTPQSPRSVKYEGQLKGTNSEREIITKVVIIATTTDGRNLRIDGAYGPNGSGTYFNNPPGGINVKSTYEGYLHESKLKTYKISVTFKRYTRDSNGNLSYDREYTAESIQQSW